MALERCPRAAGISTNLKIDSPTGVELGYGVESAVREANRLMTIWFRVTFPKKSAH